jgi:microcompartment protein CcmK/EutM
MILAEVVGTVVSTRKDSGLVGFKLLLTREVDLTFQPTGSMVVAADAVGAGLGEIVLVASGSSARLTEVTRDRPVDAVIAGIVDSVEARGQTLYRKNAGAEVA